MPYQPYLHNTTRLATCRLHAAVHVILHEGYLSAISRPLPAYVAAVLFVINAVVMLLLLPDPMVPHVPKAEHCATSPTLRLHTDTNPGPNSNPYPTVRPNPNPNPTPN